MQTANSTHTFNGSDYDQRRDSERLNSQLEIWADVEGYEGWYQVSNFGRFKRIRRGFSTKIGRILKGSFQRQGYATIDLSKDGISKKYIAHRFVAKAFIPNPENKPEVNHKDGNKANNHVSNLEWVTSSENMRHAFDTGLEKPMQGEAHHQAKLTEKDVFKIRELIEEGMSCPSIAKQFGMNRNSILNIKRGLTWSHI